MSARTWRSRTVVLAAPERVLDTLIDPAACARWSPVAFELEEGARRLRPGSVRRVRGRVLGAPVRFRLHTLRADAHGLSLHARGPIDIRVRYWLTAVAQGCHVEARLSIDAPAGRVGGLVERATGMLLAAGTLDRALARIAREAEREPHDILRGPD
jgi:hypothetical protein